MRKLFPLLAAVAALAILAGPASANHEFPEIFFLKDAGSAAIAVPDTFAGIGPWGVGEIEGGLPGLAEWFFEGGEGPPPIEGTLGLLGQFWGLKQCEFTNECFSPNLALLDHDPDVALTNTNPFDDNALDTIATRYIINDALQVSTVATLRGGAPGSGVADFGESFVITNISDTHQYGYFVQSVLPLLLSLDDLLDCDCDPFEAFFEALLSVEIDSEDDHSVQAQGISGFFEEVVTPGFDYADEGIPSEMLGWLADFFGIPEGEILPVGFTLEWHFDLAPGESWILSKDKRLGVPEPTSLALLGLGLVVLVRAQRRR